MSRYTVRIIVAVVLCLVAAPATAQLKDWMAGSGDWSNGDNWNPAGVPVAGDTVNLIFTDDVERTINYDYTGPPILINQLWLDMTGIGTNLPTLNIAANTLTVDEEVIGSDGHGKVQQSGGVHSAEFLAVGYDATAMGEYVLSGGSLNTVAEFVGHDATGDGTLSGGRFDQPGGTHHNSVLHVGFNAAATGVFTLNGGALVSDGYQFIGTGGTGTFTHTGGTNAIGTLLTIGAFGGSAGTYTVSGNAVLNAAAITLGAYEGAAGGTGVLHINGSSSSSVNVPGAITLYNTPGTGLNLNSGTLNVGAIDVGGVPSKFNWNGGTLHITRDVTWDAGAGANSTGSIFGSALSLSPSKTLKVTGNETIGGNGAFTLSLISGSTHTVTGDITIKPSGTIAQTRPSTFSYTNLIQAGGTLTGNFFTNTGHYIYQSGAVNASFTNAGTVSFGATWTVQGPLINETTLTVDSNQTLTAQGGITNHGTFVLDGGTIGGFGPPFTNAASGTFTAHGILAGFTNHGTMIIDGVLSTSTSSQNHGVLQGAGLVGSTQGGGGSLINSSGGIINSTVPGGTLTFSNLTNNLGGVINVGPTSTLAITTTSITNAGVINMQGASSRLTGMNFGGGLNNTGTIQGAGTITVRMSNQSGIIRASGGQLDLTASDNSVSPNSQLQVMADSTMMFHQGLSTLAGSLTMTGGTFDNNNKPFNNQGTITGHGTIRAGGLTNGLSRLISVGSGDMDVFGTFTNHGTVNIQTGRTMTFFNNVTGNGMFTGGGTAVFLANLSPGNSPGSVGFAGNVNLVGGAALNMEIGGLTPGSGYDRLQVAGQLSIGGILSLSLINGFSPSAGDTFDILDWGSLDGTFSSVVLPNLGPVMTWDASNLYSNGVLSVMSVALPGDHNLDGAVDAADYVMWRKTDSDNAQGYADWLANFGATSGSGGLTENSESLHVPEPTTGTLLLFALVALATYRRTA
jgi:hypothetical protein